ncbi:uncharacterized protein LOC128996005 [Macrosteles quadrilineatus]|uniref:uncharacterized protein LOC128996005 n=1 Tax=Macrosteles quadrilineatus TaxID=74068 RepID=UPI0023E0F8E5|nr:uncharacterized protein LOC128996005 [Macrosteles quadrilineatus]
MVTALLPPCRILEALRVIESLVETTNDEYKSKAMRLIAYFKDEWIEKVTPAAFSVFGQKNRTNNCQETLNRNINRSITPQGNAWGFWGKLLAISVKETNSSLS